MSRRHGSFSLKSEKTRFCEHPFTQMLIFWDGEVGFCCLDFQTQVSFGNVKDEGVLGIWNGAKMQGIRERVKNDILSIAPCATCPSSREFDPRTQFEVPDTTRTLPVINI